MESRTQEWFDLAIERGLHEKMEAAEMGDEIRSLARDENPVATLKLWESHDLLESVSPQLQRRKPDYDSLNKLGRIRGNLLAAGIRTRLHIAVLYYIFARLKPKEAVAAMRQLEFRQAELDAIAHLVPEGQKIVQVLKGRKTNAPKEAYSYISSLPPEMLAFIEAELPNPKALSKIRNYFQKWRPLRSALPPSNELSCARCSARSAIRQDHGTDLRHATARQGAHARRPGQNFPPVGRNQGRTGEKAGKRKKEAQGQGIRRAVQIRWRETGRYQESKSAIRPIRRRGYWRQGSGEARKSRKRRRCGFEAQFSSFQAESASRFEETKGPLDLLPVDRARRWQHDRFLTARLAEGSEICTYISPLWNLSAAAYCGYLISPS